LSTTRSFRLTAVLPLGQRGFYHAGTSLALAVAACASLPDIPRGTCGNQIVEPGEDCDTFGNGDNTSCNAQCRFECAKDANGNGPSCPVGWACGSDAICRAAKGSYVRWGGDITSRQKAYSLELADFDGDGLKDIFTNTLTDLTVRYASAAGDFSQTFDIPADAANSAWGFLSSAPDVAADLVFDLDGLVAVWRGQKEKKLVPTAYPFFPVGPDPLRFFVADAIVSLPGKEVMLFIDYKGGDFPPLGPLIGIQDPTTSMLRPLFSAPAAPGKLASNPAVANLDESTACDEFVLGFASDSVVHVYATCAGSGLNTFEPADPKQATASLLNPRVKLPDVRLDAGAKIAPPGLQLADVNGDKHLDLVIDGIIGSGQDQVYVAYGVGDGTFNSSPTPLTSPGDGLAKADTVQFNSGYPLATGQITLGDTEPDSVFSDHIALRFSSGTFNIPAPPFDIWTEAHILDINGNGLPDVIAGSKTKVDFYNGTGTVLMGHFGYTPEGEASLFAFGDFDGDLQLDVAYRERGTTDDGMSILWGHFLGAPDAPVSMGTFHRIVEIQAGVLASQKPAPAQASIGVVSNSEAENTQFVSILFGRGDRQLQSPFAIPVPGAQPGTPPLFAAFFAVGNFTSDPGDSPVQHPDIATITRNLTDGTMGLFALPTIGDAELDQTTILGSDPLGNFNDPLSNWRQVTMRAVNLDPAGSNATDEVVMLVPPMPLTKKPGTLFVMRLAGKQWTPIAKMPIGVEASHFTGLQRWRLVVADVNGDGSLDAVILADDPSGPKVWVFWNRRNGGLDPNPTSFTLAPNVTASSITAINADADPAKEIFVLTQSSGVFSAKASADGSSFTVSPYPVPGLEKEGGELIAGGDVTGDGIDDVVVFGGFTMHVYRGEPVTP
jgi:hypothetical protein